MRVNEVEKRRRRQAGEILTCRIYPEEGIAAEYFTVRVFKTQNQLKQHAKANRRRCPISIDCDGLCSRWRTRTLYNGRLKTQPAIGEILLIWTRMAPRIVAHEATHAALAYAEFKGWRLKDGDGKSAGPGEESVCYAVGDLTQQIYTARWRSQQQDE
jgi:hypothetical protein